MVRGKRGREWEGRDGVERLADSTRQHAERVQALLAAKTRTQPIRLDRPGLTIPTEMHYATTAAPTEWMTADAGRTIVDAIGEAIEDGTDRVILAWPNRPGGGFTAAALALREMRASGRLAHATVGLWPWRSGATWPARSILVHPADIAQTAARAATEMQRGATWVLPHLAHEALCLLEMRLRDLVPSNIQSRHQGHTSASGIVVRSPTLLETTSVFVPGIDLRTAPFPADARQVLRRVRDHTHMGDKNAGLEIHVAAIGDPLRAPFAIFGIPPLSKLEPLSRLMAYRRFTQTGLDAIIVDVTRTGRSELPDDWETRLTLLAQALTDASGRRPPIVALTEDAIAMRKVTRTLRSVGATLRPTRRPTEIGVYLPRMGMLGSAQPLDIKMLPAIRFDADIKDASLAGLRRDLIELGRKLRKVGDAVAAKGASEALAFLRRAASLPIGIHEARTAADILHDGNDEVDASMRAMFRPRMALARLAASADLAPAYAEEISRLLATLAGKVESWTDETPVSAKLSHLFTTQPDWNLSTTLLAMPDRRIADLFLASDRAVGCNCQVVDHRGMADAMTRQQPLRIVVVSPTPDAVRSLLITSITPERVLLLGDAAGSALLAAELAPLTRLAAFATVGGRAKALAAALHRGGADEALDVAEAEFRLAAVTPEAEIDFTRAGEAYKGDVVRLLTARNHKIAYRPTSDVLVFSAGEIRPFERMNAREVRTGDRILVLDASVREPVRRALAGSRQSLKQLTSYHDHIAQIRNSIPGSSLSEKARAVLSRMHELDPNFGPSELPNLLRWLTADQALGFSDGTKQPRAARDWPRFRVFMQAVNVEPSLAEIYWRTAVVPTRSYRAQEGHLFNQRVVQFVLDPEGVAIGAAGWKPLQGLWQLVLEAVDEIVDAKIVTSGGD
mgnify:FL=1